MCCRTQMNPRVKVNFYKPYLLIRGAPPVIMTLCWSYHSTVLLLLPMMVKSGRGNDNSHNRWNYLKPLWNLGVFDVSIGPQCSKPARARILRHFVSTWPVLRNTSGKSFRIKIIRNNPFWWLKSYSMKIIQNNSFANHSWSKTFHELLANN